MRQIIFDGRIGRDGAEMKTTKNGKPYARFSVANRTYSNGEEKTEWFDVTWFEPNEKIVEYLTSGTYVIVSGSIRFEPKIDKNGRMWSNFYVNASSVDKPSLGRRTENGEDGEQVHEDYNRQPSAPNPSYQQPQAQYQQQPQVQYQQPAPQYQQQPQVTVRAPQPGGYQQQAGYQQQGGQYPYQGASNNGAPKKQSMLEQKTIDPDYYSTEVESTVPGAKERIVHPEKIKLPKDDPALGMQIEPGDTDDLPF